MKLREERTEVKVFDSSIICAGIFTMGDSVGGWVLIFLIFLIVLTSWRFEIWSRYGKGVDFDDGLAKSC
jgi:hypothetical protein